MTITLDATSRSGPAAGSLAALFSPNAVAIIGASDDTRKYGNWIAVQALKGDRPVHLVNRTRATVLGRAAVRSAVSVGSPIDLAVIAVPAAGFEEAVDDALAAGARAIVGISAGLGEAGEEGRRLEERITAKVRAAGARMLGPNCLGVLDHGSGLTLASNEFPVGSIGVISQSGNMALELATLLVDHGLGVSRFASLGNQADLDAADLIEAYAGHEGTAAIAVYCEDFHDGRRFARAAARAAAAGKPVVLLTVGATDASVRNAKSHTGAMVSSGIVVDAACRAAGIEQVSSPAQMAHLLQALVRSRVPRGGRTAVFADGGGQASVASDCAAAQGLEVAEFPAELQAAVAAELPATAAVSNPVDVAGGGEQDIMCFPRVLEQLTASPAVDATLMSGYFGGYGSYGPELAAREIEAARAMAASTAACGGTVVVQTMNWQSAGADALREGGVPVYRGIEEAAWVLGRLARRQAEPATGIPLLPAAATPVRDTGYYPSRALLAGAGIPFIPAAEVSTEEELLGAAAGLSYPLVLKALGDDHKSDRGGVILNIADEPGLLTAWRDVTARLAPPSCSVEQMADLSGAVELLVGIRRDPRFGPIVLVGLGGVFAEILRDVRCALGPVSVPQARDLLLSLRGAALLTGARGRAPVDLDAAADVVARLSELAAAHPEIAEIECNPVAAMPGGALALDARIVLG
ncbi:acetate--CoA ligase family protein [Paenarthrobacter sp. PH39-S1]|uniref:acetate--CoA ligase family protein n=1 Tax=Paenarthrobacter sp. PH39-S1 TaxID=3046204 RepID=UPI0024BAF592|nr:acetate--CoA ligase family protein [Paenarthrobacter sp. PH39-S1]MDJ0357350.1 acetate--CoA ligase family protein [Paenarthrobacter sp. PH39-S1]